MLQSHSVHNNYSNIWRDSWLAHSIAFHPVNRLGKIWILLKSLAHAKMKNLEDASDFSKSVWLQAMSKKKRKKKFGSFSWQIEKKKVPRPKSGLTTGLMGSCELFQNIFLFLFTLNAIYWPVMSKRDWKKKCTSTYQIYLYLSVWDDKTVGT